MFQDPKYETARQSSFVLSYGLFRAASLLAHPGLRSRLEENALSLLTAIAAEKFEEAITILRVIKSLVRLAIEINIFHPANGNVLLNESGKLELLIAGLLEKRDRQLPDQKLQEIFSGEPDELNDTKLENTSQFARAKELTEVFKITPQAFDQSQNLEIADNPEPIGDRQGEILEIIRQNSRPEDDIAGCRLHDIKELLPEVSERTIRYDLQRLIKQGMIERLGTGPTSSYRIKEFIA